jgi:hypothetical protein
MAKGQMRSNKETRKPKKDKVAKPTSSEGSLGKLAGSTVPLVGKKKKD